MRKLFILLLLVIAAGCTEKYAKPGGEEMTGGEGVMEETLQPEKSEGMEEEVIEERPLRGDEGVTESTLKEETMVKEAFEDVMFDYDKYDIRPDARTQLNSIADFLNSNKGTNIVIEGHCDNRGTNEYNLALGERRAKAAKNYLVSRGVSPDRMIVITFGEEKPVCTEDTESCWQKNRRAHFVSVKSRFQQ